MYSALVSLVVLFEFIGQKLGDRKFWHALKVLMRWKNASNCLGSSHLIPDFLMLKCTKDTRL